jgi:hypothetical protein
MTLYTVSAMALNVHCENGQSLQAALVDAQPGTTIFVTGLCKETISIPRDSLTIVGTGSTEITGGGSSVPVITIAGRRNIVIKQLIVSDGLEGVLVHSSTGIVLEEIKATQNTNHGFRIDAKSQARLLNCTASHNNGNGFSVLNGSVASFLGSTLSEFNRHQNSDQGMCMLIDNDATAIFSKLATPTDQKVSEQNKPLPTGSIRPIGVSRSVSLAPGTCTVTLVGCSRHGICALSSSGVLIDPGCEVTSEDNGGDGVHVFDSSFELEPSSIVTSQNNSHNGLQFSGTSSGVFYNTHITAHSNNRNGYMVTGTEQGTGGVSTITIHGSTVIATDNGRIHPRTLKAQYDGIQTTGNAVIEIDNNSIIQSTDNFRFGLYLLDTSTVTCVGTNSGTLILTPNGVRSLKKQSTATFQGGNCHVFR